jgi:putative ABC transport system permease protein
MRGFLLDLRLAVRRLLRGQGFAAVAALTLALGIGANATIFALVDSTLLRPLPFHEPERLVALKDVPPPRPDAPPRKNPYNPVTPANLLDWRIRSRTIDDFAARAEGRSNFSASGEAREVRLALVSNNFFALLGTQPALGRLFDAGADSAMKEVVLTQAFWQRQFGAERSAIGATVRLGDEPYTVVGVLPERYEMPGSKAEVYIPLRMVPGDRKNFGRYLDGFGRMKPGVTVEQAQSDMSGIAAQLSAEYPDQNGGTGVKVLALRESLLGDARPPLLLLLGAVAILLLIVCANVANLLLGRAAGRTTEMAIRQSLGATRGVLVRQLLAESLVLAVVGGAIGLLLAVWATDFVVGQLGPGSGLTLRGGVKIGGAVLAFTAAITVLTALLFGVVPALATSSTAMQGTLRGGGRGLSADRVHTRWRNALIVGEVALALVLLAGAGVLARSFQNLLDVNPGFEVENRTAMRLMLASQKYDTAPPIFQFTDRLFQRIAALPGVEAVGAINQLPIAGRRTFTGFRVAGRPLLPPSEENAAEIRIVAGDYFGAMGIPVKQGRAFEARDAGMTGRKFVVDEALVRRCFRDEDPIGKHLIIPWGEDMDGEIIGVVGSVRHVSVDAEPDPAIYWVNTQAPSQNLDVIVRSKLPAARLASSLRAEVAAVDPLQPVAEIRPLREVIDQDVARPRLLLVLVGFFAGAALLLAGIGLYGVISHAVGLRTREIGIRMALGATPGSVLGLILRQGMTVTLVGLAIGIAIALAGGKIVAGALYGVPPRDPVSLTVSAAFLAVVALCASLLPARRAVAIDPMAALRQE